MAGRVVLLHGTSSSGKTTVARAVQRLSIEYDLTVDTSVQSPEACAAAIIGALAR